ncbi:hypothetical protein CTAYLR_000037 [Chrysophaeum taylorii]|uniref:Purple acid phosphatase n=1 Tax=Chrysophaeum taylorii TaxID=2483200 RepID=A0AAD7UGM9_9STRA|nr:hypothetical protein CTAYLR_000037 [Chrysophaeum taylorii]
MEKGISHSLQRIPPPWELRVAPQPNVSLSVTPSILGASGDRVTVRVRREGSSDRRITDFLAAYTPAGTNISAKAPARVVNMSQIEGYVESGDGIVELELTNMRSTYDFVLFSAAWWCENGTECDDWWYFGGSRSARYQVARSGEVGFANYDEARAARVVPDGDDEGWRLVWTSREPGGSCLVNGVTVVEAKSQSLGPSDLCGSPATDVGFNCDPPTTNSVPVRCGDSYECGGLLRGEVSCSNQTVLVVFGDLGRGTYDDSETWKEYGSPAAATAKALATLEEHVDLVYHIGDISYAVGYLSVWDDYLDMMAPAFRKFKYATTLGNHEVDFPRFPLGREPSYYTGYDSGGECGATSQALFPMPSPWWSRTVGLARVVTMATEYNFTRGSPQWEWLRDDLASVDRSVTPWIIFGGHRAGYVDSSFSSSADNGVGDVENMDLWIEHVEPLLLEAKVDLAVWGHNHAAQRLCACARGECVNRSAGNNNVFFAPKAPVHAVVGTGGAAFTENSYGAPFAERVFYKWGYARLQANTTHLEWRFVDNGRNGPGSFPGQILDSMTIVRDIEETEKDASAAAAAADNSGGGDLAVLLIAAVVIVVLLAVRYRTPSAKTSRTSTAIKDCDAGLELPVSRLPPATQTTEYTTLV